MEEQLWAVFQACNPDTEGFISIQELANISRLVTSFKLALGYKKSIRIRFNPNCSNIKQSE